MAIKKKKLALIIASFFVVVFLALLAAITIDRRSSYQVTEERIFDFNAQYGINFQPNNVSQCFVSPDGSHILMQFKIDGRRSAVLWDGIPGKTYAPEEIRGLKMSPDGQRYAYTTIESANTTTTRMIIDGVEGKTRIPKFMPYGYSGNLQFSPDGKHVAYVAVENGKHFVVIDGKESDAKFDNIGYLTFNKDWTRFAYCGEKQDNAYFLVQNDGSEKKYDGPIHDIQFSQDGKHLGYIVNDKPYGYTVVIDGEESKSQENCSAYDLQLSPNGQHSAYIFSAFNGTQGFQQVILDGQAGEKYASISSLRLFKNGQSLAYVVNNPDLTQSFILDDKKLSGYKEIYRLATSPDDEHVACIAYYCPTITRAVIRDGVQEKQFSSAGVLSVNGFDGVFSQQGPVFSPDSQHLAYIASGGPIVDGKEQKSIADAACWPVFTPDSKQLAYVAYQYGTKLEKIINNYKSCKMTSGYFIVAADKCGPMYPWVSIPAFKADGTLVYYAIRDNVLYRVTKKP